VISPGDTADVPIVLLNRGVSGTPGLSSVNPPTLAGVFKPRSLLTGLRKLATFLSGRPTDRELCLDVSF
jgi:hypothetical protein